MSSCPQILARLHRYLDGELQDLHAHEVNLHVAHCASCAAELEKLRALHRSTEGALRNEAAPPEFDTGVLQAVQRFKEGGGYGGGPFAMAMRRLHDFISSIVGPGFARPFILVAVGCLALFSTYGAYENVFHRSSGPQTVVLAQTTLPQGESASLRVLTYQDAKTQAPLPDAPVSIQIRSNSAGEWQQLYKGSTNQWGTVDARFQVPSHFQGDCQLQVLTGTAATATVLTCPVKVMNPRECLELNRAARR